MSKKTMIIMKWKKTLICLNSIRQLSIPLLKCDQCRIFIWVDSFIISLNFIILQFAGNSNSMEQAVSTTNIAIGGLTDYKHLNRMVEGYHQFLSLRKAGFAMVNDNANLQSLSGEGEIPRSHFDTFKLTCKIMVNKKLSSKIFLYFIHRVIWNTIFSTDFFGLSANCHRKIKLAISTSIFNSFYFKSILFGHSTRIFCNAERAFRTSKIFGPGDDRLIMPDGVN